MSWDDFWTYYMDCGSDRLRADNLGQLNLKALLKHQPESVQLEVLSNAPKNICHWVADLLHGDVRIKLGIAAKPEKKKKDDIDVIAIAEFFGKVK